jgi:glucose uptake protein
MYQPQSYAITLFFIIVALICWGSWANTVKLCPRYRFHLVYWDYVAGIAVAFPIGIVLALVVGAVTSYLIAPNGNPWLLFGGISLVVMAIVFDAGAYRLREREHTAAKPSRHCAQSGLGPPDGLLLSLCVKGHERRASSWALQYSVCVFARGVACSIPANYLVIRRPVDGGTPVSMRGYLRAPLSWHSCSRRLAWKTASFMMTNCSSKQAGGVH